MKYGILTIVWMWLLALLMLPALIVLKIAFSFPADAVPPYLRLLQHGDLHISSDAFSLIFSDPIYANALLLSLKVAGLSTVICLIVGYPMALAIARSGERWRSLLLILVMLPFWTGFLMLATRAKAIMQVLGYLLLENGIFLFGLLLLEAVPSLVELGVLLDLFTGVFVMSIIIYHINREFNSTSTEHLSKLKG